MENMKYAGVGRRFVAVLIDTAIIMIASMVLGVVGGISRAILGDTIGGMLAGLIQLVSSLMAFGYAIYFVGSKGQTPGKMAMGIKVVKVDTGEVPGYVSAFLREFVGKLVSSLIFLLGYFWAIWDVKKQGWHDKIANTVVVKV